MTDVRERQSRLEIDAIDAPRRPTTLVSRALAPIRRVASQDLIPLPARELSQRISRSFDVDLETQNFSRLIKWSFVVVVLLPMLFSGAYFLFWASDQYVAEARFAVREVDAASGMAMSDQKGGTESGGGGALGISLNLKGQNAEIVANYIRSRAIIDDVSRTIDVRKIFRRPGADFIARLKADASEEDLTDYWNRMVSVYIETSSGIVTVSASAFRRQDALDLLNAILKSSEALVNSLSVKMRADQTKLAEDEVRHAEGEVRFALADLQSFRNAQHIIDPVKSSEGTTKLLVQLMGKRIEAESALYVAERVQSANAPGVASLRARIDSVNGQIKSLQDQLAGDAEATRNMAATISRFEELMLHEKFAERLFTFAQNSLERARIAALRRSIYLTVFVPPLLPQDYTYPFRWTDFLLVSVAGFMIWVCGLTISASIIDHRI